MAITSKLSPNKFSCELSVPLNLPTWTQTTQANLQLNSIRTAHYKNFDFDFGSKMTKSKLTQTCKRATPTEWAKYTQGSFVIKCLISDDMPYLPETNAI